VLRSFYLLPKIVRADDGERTDKRNIENDFKSDIESSSTYLHHYSYYREQFFLAAMELNNISHNLFICC